MAQVVADIRTHLHDVTSLRPNDFAGRVRVNAGAGKGPTKLYFSAAGKKYMANVESEGRHDAGSSLMRHSRAGVSRPKKQPRAASSTSRMRQRQLNKLILYGTCGCSALFHSKSRMRLEINGAPFSRVRRFIPERTEGFRPSKNAKYLQPRRTGAQIYLPPLGNWEEIANDVRVPIIITEGEAKAIVGSLRLMPTIALGGVYSFALPNGELHPVLANIRWEGRPVYLIFDSDASYNSAVAAAEARLAAELFYKRRAALKIIRLPTVDGGKVEASTIT